MFSKKNVVSNARSEIPLANVTFFLADNLSGLKNTLKALHDFKNKQKSIGRNIF